MTDQTATVASRSQSRTGIDAPLIVVIEDDRAQQMALTAALEGRGYRVTLASTAGQAVKLIRLAEPDIVLLDLDVPDADGLDLCRHVRVLVRCPIIIVSSDVLEDRAVEALDIGADDYVVKPFSMKTLMARVRVALRHHAATSAILVEELLTAGDVVVDVPGHRVVVAGDVVELQARQFALLTILMRNVGKVVTYAGLSRALGSSGSSATDQNGLRVLVSKLRKQLGSGELRPIITTELHVGYRLSVPEADRTVFDSQDD